MTITLERKTPKAAPTARRVGLVVRVSTDRQAMTDEGSLVTQLQRLRKHLEYKAVTGVFGTDTPCSSTKGATGHTLGAAGALEAVIAVLALRHGFMPGGANTQRLDPALRAHYLLETRTAPVRRVLSNSFGFGGTNCSLVLGRA